MTGVMTSMISITFMFLEQTNLSTSQDPYSVNMIRKSNKLYVHYYLLVITLTPPRICKAVGNTPKHLISHLRRSATHRFMCFKEGGCWLAWSLLAWLIIAMYGLFSQSYKQQSTMSLLIDRFHKHDQWLTWCGPNSSAITLVSMSSAPFVAPSQNTNTFKVHPKLGLG